MWQPLVDGWCYSNNECRHIKLAVARQRRVAALSGETNTTLTLTQAHVAYAIYVTASYIDDDGFTHSLNSASTDPVENVNDPATGQPIIQGGTTLGGVLSVDLSSISDPDGMTNATSNNLFEYQWRRNGQIFGATNDGVWYI